MAELFEHLDQFRSSPGKVAVATLVNTRGTTPRKEGAKMVVGEGGAVLGSVTIGGCVDAQVIEESTHVLETMRPRLLELNLGDEEAWEIGLTCGGTIEVFLEPVRPGRSGAGSGGASTSVSARHAGDRPARSGDHPAGRGRCQAPRSRRRYVRKDRWVTRCSIERFAAEARVALDQRDLAHPRAARTSAPSWRCLLRPRCSSWSAPATWPCRWSALPRFSVTARSC